MNSQMLLECHAAGTAITVREAQLLDLELDSQIASIKVSRTQGCIEVAPDHIPNQLVSAKVVSGSLALPLYLIRSLLYQLGRKQEAQQSLMS